MEEAREKGDGEGGGGGGRRWRERSALSHFQFAGAANKSRLGAERVERNWREKRKTLIPGSSPSLACLAHRHCDRRHLGLQHGSLSHRHTDRDLDIDLDIHTKERPTRRSVHACL